MVGNGLHSISGWFKVGLGWRVNAFSSHSIHKAKEIGPQSTKGSFLRCKGVGFPRCKVMVLQANRVGSWSWPCGFACHYYLGFDVVWVEYPTMFVFIICNEGGVTHHMQGRHTQSLWIGLGKLVVLTLNIHQIFN